MKRLPNPAVDERWMQRALALARRGQGLTRPNPPVGAVVVRGGRAVGEGWHRKAGGPHAEVFALRAAGARARGATLYVTLEPCSTFGRTPPCTDAIQAAGIARVVVATADPNPRHAGRGLRLLARLGLEVSSGICSAEAQALIEPFALRMLKRRPFVTLKLGVTLDGRIADRRGKSKWITGPAARRHVQALRRRVDAILVGAGTVRADDPQLTPRPAAGRRPLRVVVSQSGRLPARAQLFTDDRATDTLVYVPAAAVASTAGRATVVTVRRSRVSLSAVLKDLARRDVMHVLCEGGGELAAVLLRAGLVDELQWIVAPRLLGATGRPAVGGPGWPLAGAPPWKITTVQRVGDDVLLVARRR